MFLRSVRVEGEYWKGRMLEKKSHERMLEVCRDEDISSGAMAAAGYGSRMFGCN